MADLNQFSRGGVIWKQWNPQTVDRQIDTFWMRENKVANASVLKQFYDVVPMSEGLDFVITSLGSALPLPVESEDTAPLAVVQSAPGFKKTFTVVNYRSSIQVTDTAMRTDRSGKLMQTLNGPMKASTRFDEYMRAKEYVNGFTGTSGADSLPMCSNSHPHENFDMGTYDNLSTGALTGPNLQAAILVMDLLTDEQNDPMDVNARTLLVPTSLRQKALELTSIGGARATKPDGALNNPNVIINDLTPVVSKYLSSQTAFFVHGDLEGEAKGLLEVQLMDWDLSPVGDETVDVPVHRRIKGIKTFGLTRTKNIVGSTGA